MGKRSPEYINEQSEKVKDMAELWEITLQIAKKVVIPSVTAHLDSFEGNGEIWEKKIKEAAMHSILDQSLWIQSIECRHIGP